MTHPRFTALDGLRGVAALIVINVHIGWKFGVWQPRFGYLAVDVFFLLSGFVLAMGYEPRFCQGLSARQFLKIRLIRLGPLYLLGLILGICTAPLNIFVPLTAADIFHCAIFNFFGLPSMTPYKDSTTFDLDLPLWSLFFEFWVANVAFAALRDLLSNRVLWAIIAVSAICLLMAIKQYHTLMVGFYWNSFLFGFPRVIFSFFLGVAIARAKADRSTAIAVPSWLLVLGLPILLCLPLQGRTATLFELACVFLVFPMVIYLGSNAKEGNPRLGQALGDASYALYTIHYPVYILAAWLLVNLHISPAWQWQLLFVVLILPVAWALNPIDARLRAGLQRSSS
jgi:peptidoglycan/LPS O-acetylase OafA/YrhL